MTDLGDLYRPPAATVYLRAGEPVTAELTATADPDGPPDVLVRLGPIAVVLPGELADQLADALIEATSVNAW